MKIAIDAMGGDFAPQVTVAAARLVAEKHPEVELMLVATETALNEAGALPKQVTPVVCGSVMAMDEDVRSLVRKKDSSIWMATELVKNGAADAIVSAGSTAAQMTAATLLLGRIPGVSRPAIGTVLPTLAGGKLLLDVGANADCTPEMLLQFAQMGTVYAESLLDIDRPRIALLANGTEEHKGNNLTRAAYELLKESSLVFIGNMEGRDILTGNYDVMVCDGMNGNIALKSTEGAIKTMMVLLKRELGKTAKAKLGALLLKKSLYELKRSMDYQEYGGAPLLGVGGVSIICHGSSQTRALVTACQVASKCVEENFVGTLTSSLAKIKQ